MEYAVQWGFLLKFPRLGGTITQRGAGSEGNGGAENYGVALFARSFVIRRWELGLRASDG